MAPLETKAPGLSLTKDLLHRYDQTGPRYTSYPTAPEWKDEFGAATYRDLLREKNLLAKPLSLYVHLPFCERACYFCGCNTVITKKRELADVYLAHLEKELDTLAGEIGGRGRIVQLQWGGGTPTYLSSRQLEQLFRAIDRRFLINRAEEVSLEIHPNVTSDEQLQTLAGLGFNRLSMGVQDFDPQVQKAVNRIERRERVDEIVRVSRALGFRSINIDLIYGLPLQTVESFEKTIEAVIQISPDRIALFNYAHVPWMKPFQKYIRAEDLPSGAVKFELFRRSIALLTGAGYRFVGLDHFAKPEDELVRAQENRTLKRNFMGYTTHEGTYLLGVGESAIGMMHDVYVQNEKKLARYQALIAQDGLATVRGVRLAADDLLRRDVIVKILCHASVRYAEFERAFAVTFANYFSEEMKALPRFEADGLLRMTPDGFSITPLGRIFVRNIAMTFDAYLKNPAGRRQFSRTL